MMEDIDAIYEAEDTSEDGTMPLATEPLDPTSTTDFPPQSRRHLPLSRTSTASSTLSAIIAKNSAASTKSSFPANIARVSLTTRTAYSERSKGINGNSTAGHSAARAGVNSMKHTSNRCLKRRSGKITDRDRSKCKHHTLYELTATTRAAIPGSLISPLVCWDRSWVSWVIVLSVARRRAPNARKQHTLEALHAKTYGNRLSKKIFRTSTVAVKTRKSAPLVRNGPQVANGRMFELCPIVSSSFTDV